MSATSHGDDATEARRVPYEREEVGDETNTGVVVQGSE